VRRLTALEIAIGHLKNDCEVISKKRLDVIQKVVATQHQSVSQVKEVRFTYYDAVGVLCMTLTQKMIPADA
jgi:hypothetical protein